ncbi:MAG: HEPN domain-containing protein [Bacteroidetes bacterium]|nr:HEPN domain-containing protein [Bacteroidota bacterium]
MTIGNRADYIKYRYLRAEETFDDAIILSEKNKWNAVINRLYFTCFYAVIALLLKNDITTKTHDNARTQFSLHFVKTGIIDKKFGKLYTKLFDYRQKGDYGDLFDFDKDTVEPLITSVREFIDEIKKHVVEN